MKYFFTTLTISLLLTSFCFQIDVTNILTGGNQKTWVVQYLLFDESDLTDSLPCIKGGEVTFHNTNNFSYENSCSGKNKQGSFHINHDYIIMDTDTFSLEELTTDKLKYSRKKKSVAKFEGEAIVEMEHIYTLILYPKK